MKNIAKAKIQQQQQKQQPLSKVTNGGKNSFKNISSFIVDDVQSKRYVYSRLRRERERERERRTKYPPQSVFKSHNSNTNNDVVVVITRFVILWLVLFTQVRLLVEILQGVFVRRQKFESMKRMAFVSRVNKQQQQLNKPALVGM